MVVPSPVGGVNIVSPISAFVLNTLTLKISAFCFVFLRLNSGRRVAEAEHWKAYFVYLSEGDFLLVEPCLFT